MIYTIEKDGEILYSGIYTPNLMNWKDSGASYTVRDKEGELLLSQVL